MLGEETGLRRVYPQKLVVGGDRQVGRVDREGRGRREAAGPINTEWTQFFAVLLFRCLFLYRSPFFVISSCAECSLIFCG